MFVLVLWGVSETSWDQHGGGEGWSTDGAANYVLYVCCLLNVFKPQFLYV